MAKPWQTHEEYLTDVALQSALASPDEVRVQRNLNAPVLFPDHRGVQRKDAGISDILSINRYAANNRSYISGMPVRNSFVDDEWSGSGRYSMEPLG